MEYTSKFTVGEQVFIPSHRAFLDDPNIGWSATVVGIYITKTNQFYDVVRDYDSVVERVEATVVEATTSTSLKR